MLDGQKFAGAADPGLHLIGHQQHIVFRAQRGNRLQIGGFQCDDAALSLYAFQQDRADGGIQRLFERADIAGLRVAEPPREGVKIPVEPVLAGSRQGGHRAAVEGIDQRDDGRAAFSVMVEAVLAGQLDRAFVPAARHSSSANCACTGL